VIVLDTETTGLILNPALPLDQQPEIIELAAVRLHDDTLAEEAHISFFVKPKRLVREEKIIKSTGITDDMLTSAPSFARQLPTIVEFFLGERIVVAHNCAYDMGMLALELARLDRVTKFPWPVEHICTVETNMDVLVQGGRKLDVLYGIATGGLVPPVKHRALDDVRTLCTVVRWMRGEGKL
jgi:DNA polymerase-3 subunit alpha (Gram-positive type)